MTTFLILFASFVLAAAGIVQSSQAPPEKRTLLGVTVASGVMLLVALIGFAASAAQEVAEAKEAAQLQRRAEADSQLLKLVNAKLDYLSGVTGEPEMVLEIERLRDQMNLAASRSRWSDFSLSDLSRSRFDRGNFTLTSFPGALFKNSEFFSARFDGSNFKGASFTGARFSGADFRGVDLSEIVIDDSTRLPERSSMPPNPPAAPDVASPRQ